MFVKLNSIHFLARQSLSLSMFRHGYSRIGIYATCLYAIIAYMQLFFGSQSDFCTENTTILCNRRIYATFLWFPSSCIYPYSTVSLFYCIVKIRENFSGLESAASPKAT